MFLNYVSLNYISLLVVRHCSVSFFFLGKLPLFYSRSSLVNLLDLS